MIPVSMIWQKCRSEHFMSLSAWDFWAESLPAQWTGLYIRLKCNIHFDMTSWKSKRGHLLGAYSAIHLSLALCFYNIILEGFSLSRFPWLWQIPYPRSLNRSHCITWTYSSLSLEPTKQCPIWWACLQCNIKLWSDQPLSKKTKLVHVLSASPVSAVQELSKLLIKFSEVIKKTEH